VRLEHLWLLALPLLAVAGCNVDLSGGAVNRAESNVIAEGVLYSVRYDRGDGKPRQITRYSLLSEGGGEWNIDARAKLTREALIITYPKKTGFGPHVIPMGRLHEVQFGDGMITMPIPSSTPTPMESDHHAAENP
jgi:hypothetical protein